MLDAKLSLVLPAHNEADNIEVVVHRALQVLPKILTTFEILIVNDGSIDFTGEIAEQLAAEQREVQVVHHQQNQGYGAALRSGFEAASGELTMFMDADRQFDIADINALLPYVPHFDVIAGYRIKRRDRLYRKVYAQIFDVAVWILFGVHMRDVDCAFKIYPTALVKTMPLAMPGALINTEMLAMARRMGASVVEVGVHHYPRTAGISSGGSPRVVLRAVGETLRLWWRMRDIDLPAWSSNGGESKTAKQPWAPGFILGLGAALVSIATLLIWRRKR